MSARARIIDLFFIVFLLYEQLSAQFYELFYYNIAKVYCRRIGTSSWPDPIDWIALFLKAEIYRQHSVVFEPQKDANWNGGFAYSVVIEVEVG